jgi:hypothetical protein
VAGARKPAKRAAKSVATSRELSDFRREVPRAAQPTRIPAARRALKVERGGRRRRHDHRRERARRLFVTYAEQIWGRCVGAGVEAEALAALNGSGGVLLRGAQGRRRFDRRRSS